MPVVPFALRLAAPFAGVILAWAAFLFLVTPDTRPLRHEFEARCQAKVSSLLPDGSHLGTPLAFTYVVKGTMTPVRASRGHFTGRGAPSGALLVGVCESSGTPDHFTVTIRDLRTVP